VDFRPIQHGVTDSTNERALQAIGAGQARDGDVHLALEQTSGRGRLGRVWQSPPGAGLYMSVVHMPPEPILPSALTMGAGLALFDSVAALGLVEEVALKWPNDLLVSGAKLAGVLVETRGLDARRPHYVVGIGLNVGQEDFPTELAGERAVTSLRLRGIECSVEEAQRHVLAMLPLRLEQARGDHAALVSDYLRATDLAGRLVRVRYGQTEVCVGRVRELSLETGLAIEEASGKLRRIALEFVRELTDG
jgi:BirA family biotin operon repressor/biotin-[acetyl-CoA-carboxylase] ligase